MERKSKLMKYILKLFITKITSQTILNLLILLPFGEAGRG
jgi:hypothetical protein